MMRRGSKRSASTPACRENNRNGSQCEITAYPPRAGEWNFSNIIHQLITCSIESAIIASIEPTRYGAKPGARSAAKARDGWFICDGGWTGLVKIKLVRWAKALVMPSIWQDA